MASLHCHIHVLVMFLLRKCVFLRLLWSESRISALRCLSEEVILRKVRGILMSVRQADLSEAFKRGLLDHQELLDAAYSIIHRLKWQEIDILMPILNEHARRRLIADSDAESDGEAAAPTPPAHSMDPNSIEGREVKAMHWLETLHTAAPSSHGFNYYEERDGAVAGPSGCSSNDNSNSNSMEEDDNDEGSSTMSGLEGGEISPPSPRRTPPRILSPSPPPQDNFMPVDQVEPPYEGWVRRSPRREPVVPLRVVEDDFDFMDLAWPLEESSESGVESCAFDQLSPRVQMAEAYNIELPPGDVNSMASIESDSPAEEEEEEDEEEISSDADSSDSAL